MVPGGISGTPTGTAVALALDVPFVIDRGEPKAYGKKKRFEGKFNPTRRCLVLDDLVTAGGTINKTVAALHETGYPVPVAKVVVVREEGEREEMEANGVRLDALVTKAVLSAAMRQNRRSD